MLTEWTGWHRLALTVAILVAVLAIRHFGIRNIKRGAGILNARHRRWISNLHHGSIAVILLVLLAIWLPQLQRFILSITAIAVALVVATKELLLCLLGTVLVRSSRAFVIGDWIDAQGGFGEVIERNLLSTTVQEIETRGYTSTGRTVTLPNSLFLAAPVTNQNFLRRYRFHSFSVTIEPDAFPIDAEAKLLARINALTAPFAETARRYNTMLENRTGIDIPDAGASIEFATNDIAKFVTTITVFCPTERIVELEGAMMREFFDWYRMHRVRPNDSAPVPEDDPGPVPTPEQASSGRGASGVSPGRD